MSVKVSIVIPIYNVETYIVECLESVKNAIKKIQAEVIIIDDGSTDKSSELAKKFASEEESFFYYRKENEGVGSARNYGVEISSGEYLVFVDPDDTVEDNYLTDMLAVAEKYNCDFVLCDAMRKKGSITSYSSLHRRAYYNIRNLKLDIEKMPLLIYDSTSCNRIIRKEFFVKHNIRYPEGCRYEDYPVMQKMLLCADNARFVRNWGYNWRIRTDGTSSITKDHTDKRNLTDKIYTLELARQFAKNHNAPDHYFRYLDYKILALEFNGTIGAFKDVPESVATEHMDIAANYIEENVNLDVMEELPIYDRQKIEYILKRDLQGLKRLMNYKEINYDKAPVSKKDGKFIVELPNDIFTVPGRDMRNEHARIPYYQGIDSIKFKDDELSIHAHIYLRRINIEKKGDQKIDAYVVNASDDGEIVMDVRNELRPSLTKNRGHVVSSDDYRDYYYNYDGAGFKAMLSIDKLTADSRFIGKNYVFLECTNEISHTEQLLRYASMKTRKQLAEGMHCERNGCFVTVSLNAVDVLEISVEKYLVEDISKKDNNIIFRFSDPLHINNPVLVGRDGQSFDIDYDKEEGVYIAPLDKLFADNYYLSCKSMHGRNLRVRTDKEISSEYKTENGRLCIIETDAEKTITVEIIENI